VKYLCRPRDAFGTDTTQEEGHAQGSQVQGTRGRQIRSQSERLDDWGRELAPKKSPLAQ